MNIILLKSHEIQFKNLILTFPFSEKQMVRHLQIFNLQNIDIVNGFKQTAKRQYNVINISSPSYWPLLTFRTIIPVHCTRVCMQVGYKKKDFSEHWFRMQALHSFGRMFQYSCLEHHQIFTTSCILFFPSSSSVARSQCSLSRLGHALIHHIKNHSRQKPQGRLMYCRGHSLRQERGCHSLGIRLGLILRIRAIRARVHSQISSELK